VSTALQIILIISEDSHLLVSEAKTWNVWWHTGKSCVFFNELCQQLRGVITSVLRIQECEV